MSDQEREIDSAADYILAFVGIAIPVAAVGYLALHLTYGLASATAAILAILLATVVGLILVRIRPVRRIVVEFFNLLTVPF
ncbi:MAG: hypothetical protein ACLFV8_05045 [Alphaproteobacteria bacterium]